MLLEEKKTSIYLRINWHANPTNSVEYSCKQVRVLKIYRPSTVNKRELLVMQINSNIP